MPRSSVVAWLCRTPSSVQPVSRSSSASSQPQQQQQQQNHRHVSRPGVRRRSRGRHATFDDGIPAAHAMPGAPAVQGFDRETQPLSPMSPPQRQEQQHLSPPSRQPSDLSVPELSPASAGTVDQGEHCRPGDHCTPRSWRSVSPVGRAGTVQGNC